MKNVIGLGGVARAGKDTFAAILEMKLQQAGKTVKKIALAGPLKQHCDKFLKDNLGISAFTQVPEEKIIIRPFLVWYGDAQRKLTEGKFWTNLASSEIESTHYDYYIITDVRYDAYPIDELNLPQWFKDLPFDQDGMEGTIVDGKVKNLLGVLNWDLASTAGTQNAFSAMFG